MLFKYSGKYVKIYFNMKITFRTFIIVWITLPLYNFLDMCSFDPRMVGMWAQLAQILNVHFRVDKSCLPHFLSANL